jgi:hypothetical protein
MGGAHVIQVVQHPELDTLGLVAIRDFLRKRARYLQLVARKKQSGRRQRHADHCRGFD